MRRYYKFLYAAAWTRRLPVGLRDALVNMEELKDMFVRNTPSIECRKIIAFLNNLWILERTPI